MKFERLGWVVAAALAGAFVATGFQGTNTKIGTVDVAKVFNDSEYTKTQTQTLQGMGKARQDVLEYLSTYRAIKTDDATKFRELSLKANPSAADTAALNALKTQIQADDVKFRDLQQKQSPTADERKLLDDYNQRAQALSALQQRWAQEFETEISGKQQNLRQAGVEKMKSAVNDVARNQGFSIVFDAGIAPYSSNDITADALKAMNKK